MSPSITPGDVYPIPSSAMKADATSTMNASRQPLIAHNHL